MSSAAPSRDLLLVTTREGTEFVPEAGFLAAAARRLGRVPRLLPTDFCTTQEGFEAAVRAAAPEAVVFLDAVEWREIVALLAGFSARTGPHRTLIAGESLVDPATRPVPPPGVGFVAGSSVAALAAALGEAPPADAAAPLAYDVDVFGGPRLLDAALGASLFGDLDAAPLLAARGSRRASSPAAALARLEGAVAEAAAIVLPPAVAHAPLERFGQGARAAEWWDRDFASVPDGAAYLEPLRARGLSQTVRLRADVDAATLARLRAAGATRVVFDCDALEGAERLPGAVATATEVASALRAAHAAGLETGVLFVTGLPGETADVVRGRLAALRGATPDRFRATPFEPTGGAAASRCRELGLWPPDGERWNRELHLPLRQPDLGADAFVRAFEEAVGFVAEVATRRFDASVGTDLR